MMPVCAPVVVEFRCRVGRSPSYVPEQRRARTDAMPRRRLRVIAAKTGCHIQDTLQAFKVISAPQHAQKAATSFRLHHCYSPMLDEHRKCKDSVRSSRYSAWTSVRCAPQLDPSPKAFASNTHLPVLNSDSRKQTSLPAKALLSPTETQLPDCPLFRGYPAEPYDLGGNFTEPEAITPNGIP
jgi:hypothetical protein